MENNESRNRENYFFPIEDASLYFGSIDNKYRNNTFIDEELFLQQKESPPPGGRRFPNRGPRG